MQTANEVRRLWNRFTKSALIFFCFTGAVRASETNFLIIKSFGNPDQAAVGPNDRLTESSDGKLYGASSAGGKYGGGTVFRINKDGTDFHVIYHFSDTGPYSVSGGVIEGSDGKLYGTTSQSWRGYGTVFAVGKDGSGFQVLHQFAIGTNDGWYPSSGVIEGSDGVLYGLTHYGGIFDQGSLFRIAKDGSSYQFLASLRGPSGLIEAGDGYLYGTTTGGGVSNAGTIFRLNEAGNDLSTVYSFGGGTNGATPGGRLVITSDGVLYGTTWKIDETNAGCVYRLRNDGSDYTILKRFDAPRTEGRFPNGLFQGSDRLLYGTLSDAEAVLGPGGWTRTHYGALFRIETNGQNFALLQTFGSTNGAFPNYPPMQAADGLFYGTTSGGASGGVLYRIQPDGSDFRVLASPDRTGGDAARPIKLIQGSDGKLYGTTAEGTGGLYQLNTNGSSYSEISAAAHGATDLIEGRDGALYATGYYGGPAGRGVVVRITKDGNSPAILWSPTSLRHGSYLQAVVHASDGRLYVTTEQGGIPSGMGVVFSIRTDGSDYRELYGFALPDGNPRRLIEGSDGWLYGIAAYDRGLIYKLHPSGSQFAVLHRFGASTNDGIGATVILEGKDGLLYGACASAGRYGGGTLFKISRSGENYERIVDLPGGTNRINVADLVEGPDGFLYGVGRSVGYDRDAIFRVGKQGKRYTIVRNLPRTDRQPSTPSSLVVGADLAIYIAMYSGGEMDLGTIVRFIPPADIELSVIGNVVRVSAVGLPNRPLRIEKSPDLVNWMTLGTSSLNGQLTVDDTKEPGAARFYRAVLE